MEPDKEKQSFLVQSEDGRKFKMVIRGDLSKLPVEKIRRYLKSYGVPEGHTLTVDGRVLTDSMIGEDFGLHTGSVLKLLASVASENSLTSNNLRGDDSILATDVEGRSRRFQMERERHAAASGASVSSSFHPTHLTDHAETLSRFARITNPAQELLNSSAVALPSPARNHTGTPRSAAQGNASPMPSFSRPSDADGSASHPLQSKILLLEEENTKLKKELEVARLETDRRKPRVPGDSLLAIATANLTELGKELGAHLVFDQNLTCVVGNDERHTILVTLDIATERLYVYSTLLSSIPDDPTRRLRLYETLLDGALLGRDMAGGGCGISLQSNIVMMSTSIQLKHTDSLALRDVVPSFVEALQRWRAVVSECS